MIRIIVLYIFCSIFIVNAASPHHEKYFQQHVKYTIDTKLNIGLNRLDVEETLLYKNNSPDTLNFIYFHLYLNKFSTGALANPTLTYDQGAIRIFEIYDNDSLSKNYQVDQTIMKVNLNNPLLPDSSTKFFFDFAAILPPASGRYGYQGYHYDVGNWYITPVVYDRAGWHLNQHLDNEFYQEWGDYRVDITVPKGFILGATGNLLNPDSALQDTLPENRDWFNVYPEDTSKTTWQFEAKMVHDFAWTADPSYVIMQSEWNGITLNVLAMDYNRESWKQVTDWGIKTIQYFCENFGMYPYKQLTVADTYIRAGGIEYPQIVMINDYINPNYRPARFQAVVIHEIAHNWFYGLLANNQTEEEWLDEGFTTFAEIKAMEHIFGRYENYNPGDGGWLFNAFRYTNDNRLDNAYQYLRLTKLGFFENPINLHSDYQGWQGYPLSYAKMADVLFMLEYTMGDSLFNLGMLNYFEKWHWRHPYPEDFIAVMEQTAGRDLDWFFEQWLNTNRKLDYAVDGFSGDWEMINAKRQYKSKINFVREEQIFMPIDFDVTLKDGTIKKYQIPVDNFPKPENGRQILPYWHFSQRNYSVELILPDEIEKIEIDPSLRLMDINMLNNYSGFLPAQEFYFMQTQSQAPPLNKYMWEIWPKVLYNDIDKAKIGMNLKGSYLNIDHNIDALIWFKTAELKVDFDLYYTTPKKWLGNLTDFELRLFTLDGRQGGRIGLVHNLSLFREPKILLDFGLANHKMFDSEYLMALWETGNVNTAYFTWRFETSHRRGWKPNEVLLVDFQTSILGSDYDFSQITMEVFKKFWNGRSDWEFDFRLFAGHGEGNVPAQFLYNLSGDNGWGEFQSPFYMSKGSLPLPWRRNGHLYKFGGGNVRGYSLNANNIALLDRNIAAVNLDIKMPNPLESLYIPIIEDISPYVFADYGAVWNTDFPDLDKFPKSAGFSLEWLTFDFLDYFFELQSIRFDFPIWLSDPATGKDNTEFRWLVRFNFTN